MGESSSTLIVSLATPSRLDRRSVTFRLAAEIIVIIVTAIIIISTIGATITRRITPVRAAVPFVRATRLGAEAVDDALASSAKPMVFATVMIAGAGTRARS